MESPLDDHQLIETLRFTPPDDLRNLAGHLDRLAGSAGYFRFRFDRAEVEGVIRAAVAGRATPARVRVLLFRLGAMAVEVGELPVPPQRPVVLAIDDISVDSASPWLRHKTSRRDVYADRAARHPAAGDVVIVNERGEITETTIANIAVLIDEQWWTPPLSSGCLPGVERARLVAAGELHERVITVADLRSADDVALVNSLRGWRAGQLASTTPSLPPNAPYSDESRVAARRL